MPRKPLTSWRTDQQTGLASPLCVGLRSIPRPLLPCILRSAAPRRDPPAASSTGCPVPAGSDPRGEGCHPPRRHHQPRRARLSGLQDRGISCLAETSRVHSPERSPLLWSRMNGAVHVSPLLRGLEHRNELFRLVAHRAARSPSSDQPQRSPLRVTQLPGRAGASSAHCFSPSHPLFLGLLRSARQPW